MGYRSQNPGSQVASRWLGYIKEKSSWLPWELGLGALPTGPGSGREQLIMASGPGVSHGMFCLGFRGCDP